MMMLLSGLVGLLLVLTAEFRVGYSDESGLCTKTKHCMLFKRVCKTDKYEVHYMANQKWATVQKITTTLDDALSDGRAQLQEYFDGANDKGAKMEVLDPICVAVPEKKSDEEGIYIVYFLLPAEYQENHPTPNNENVRIGNQPGLNVYIQQSNGKMDAESDSNAAQSLASDLDVAGAGYDDNFHFSALYQDPLSTSLKGTEVMYVARGEPVCS